MMRYLYRYAPVACFRSLRFAHVIWIGEKYQIVLDAKVLWTVLVWTTIFSLRTRQNITLLQSLALIDRQSTDLLWFKSRFRSTMNSQTRSEIFVNSRRNKTDENFPLSTYWCVVINAFDVFLRVVSSQTNELKVVEVKYVRSFAWRHVLHRRCSFY